MADDICSNRHRGNPESQAAFDFVASKIGPMHDRLLAILRRQAMTSKELERYTGMTRSTISARLSELKSSGHIVKTGQRREGAAVLTINQLHF